MNEAGGTNLQCFLRAERCCGPDCMAYLSAYEAPDGPDYAGKQWTHCLLLVNAHRVGKHLVVLASSADSLTKAVKQKNADEVRRNQPTPPGIR